MSAHHNTKTCMMSVHVLPTVSTRTQVKCTRCGMFGHGSWEATEECVRCQDCKQWGHSAPYCQWWTSWLEDRSKITHNYELTRSYLADKYQRIMKGQDFPRRYDYVQALMNMNYFDPYWIDRDHELQLRLHPISHRSRPRGSFIQTPLPVAPPPPPPPMPTRPTPQGNWDNYSPTGGGSGTGTRHARDDRGKGSGWHGW